MVHIKKNSNKIWLRIWIDISPKKDSMNGQEAHEKNAQHY